MMRCSFPDFSQFIINFYFHYIKSDKDYIDRGFVSLKNHKIWNCKLHLVYLNHQWLWLISWTCWVSCLCLYWEGLEFKFPFQWLYFFLTVSDTCIQYEVKTWVKTISVIMKIYSLLINNFTKMTLKHL